jgi:hypothetical protein
MFPAIVTHGRWQGSAGIFWMGGSLHRLVWPDGRIEFRHFGPVEEPSKGGKGRGKGKGKHKSRGNRTDLQIGLAGADLAIGRRRYTGNQTV